MSRRAFTLVELLVSVTLAVTVLAMATDLFSGGRFERIDAAARLLEADMAWARSRALASPSDPVMLRIDADGGGYRVSASSAPDVALEGPNGPIRIRFGEDRGRSAAGVRLAGAPSRDVVFGPFGGVMDPVPTLTFTMIGGDERGVLALDALTGDATVTYQSSDP